MELDLKLRFDRPVSEYLQKELVIIGENDNAKTAAIRMRDENIGSLIVTRGSEPVGIITERDILYKVVAAGKEPSTVAIRSIMSSPLKTIEHTATAAEAIATMSKEGIRRLGVVREGKIVGLVSQRKIVSDDREERILLPELERPGVKRCPYCGQVVNGETELSKHIDYVHIGRGLLEGDLRKW